ncbi:hypothetical protein [Aneurinibacillus tyrosinisolvens]|uniref:hypothetical protein n=1 Tax=Aneurinibacillus tyrosinisolvens TaxID=1443435 RepID=UPI00069B5DE1|nr:hypothetical protein [Aneurinibacillus tyrosinisolvens]
MRELKHHLKKAELYGLLMKKYEYVDPALHMHYYQKHFYHTQEVDRLYRMKHHWGAHPGAAYPTGAYSAPMGSGWRDSSSSAT